MPDNIQDEAAELAQKKKKAAKGKKRVEPWDCLNIIDYKNIAIKNKKWSEIFSEVVTLPEDSGSSGNKELKTKWMQRLSDIRNQVVHEHYVSKEELDFVKEILNFLSNKSAPMS